MGKTDKQMQIPEELEDSKLFSKLEKEIGVSDTREFFQRSEEELRATIAECEIQANEFKTQRDDNSEFKKAKQIVKDFNKACGDACKLINLKKKIAAHIIGYRNQA